MLCQADCPRLKNMRQTFFASVVAVLFLALAGCGGHGSKSNTRWALEVENRLDVSVLIRIDGAAGESYHEYWLGPNSKRELFFGGKNITISNPPADALFAPTVIGPDDLTWNPDGDNIVLVYIDSTVSSG